MELVIVIVIGLCFVAVFFFLHQHSHSSKGSVAPVEEQTTSSQHEIPEVPVASERQEQPDEGVRIAGQTEEPEKDDDEKSVIQNKQLIASLHKILEEDKVFLQPDIHIDDVARMLLTNRTYVTRMMRQEYGLTFIEYVNIARIQYSQKLLYSSDMTLDEVAEKSGFQSTSNYCRAFKRYIGTSPMGWLQKMK